MDCPVMKTILPGSVEYGAKQEQWLMQRVSSPAAAVAYRDCKSLCDQSI
jgi:hypothetical protein